MRQLRSLAALAALLVFIFAEGSALGQPAKPAKWVVDPPHCSITFRIKHMFAHVPGRFDRFEGSAVFDPARPGGGSVSFDIDAASIDTGTPKRDEHLRSPDFFDVVRFPRITFVSESIEPKDQGLSVRGKLTIKDVVREVDLPVTFLGTRESPLEKGKTVAGFESRFEIRLADYHIGAPKWQQMGVMGDAAELTVSLEMLGE